MSLSVDQKINIASSELDKFPASAYDTFCECLELDKNCASRMIEILDTRLGKCKHEIKWATLRARAYFLAGQDKKACRMAFKLVRDALLTGAIPHIDTLRIIECVARSKDASVSSILSGEKYYAKTVDPTIDILTAFYLRGVLRGQVPPGILALRNKSDIDVHGIRCGRATIPSENERYIRFLKHFSSFTPIMKNKDRKRLGGGYLFKLGHYNLVVDPGHHFLDNFFKENFRVGEINGILVTHFHDDHYADLPSLLSLLFHQRKSYGTHEVDLFTDKTTAKMFGPLIGSAPHIGRHVILIPDAEDDIEINANLHLKPIPTYHEILGEGDTGIGFYLRLGPQDKTDTILVTGDTRWDDRLVPLYMTARTHSRSLILIVHISSVYPGEIPNHFADTLNVRFYEKHLCIYGMCKSIEACQPDVVVLSEIGEELTVVLDDICQLVEGVYGVPCVIGQLGKSGDYIPLGPLNFSEWKRTRSG